MIDDTAYALRAIVPNLGQASKGGSLRVLSSRPEIILEGSNSSKRGRSAGDFSDAESVHC